MTDLGASYPDVVQALQQAKKKGALQGRFAIDAIPSGGRRYDRGSTSASHDLKDGNAEANENTARTMKTARMRRTTTSASRSRIPCPAFRERQQDVRPPHDRAQPPRSWTRNPRRTVRAPSAPGWVQWTDADCLSGSATCRFRRYRAAGLVAAHFAEDRQRLVSAATR